MANRRRGYHQRIHTRTSPKGKKFKAGGKRVLGYCGLCREPVYNVGHRDILNRLIPDYKNYEGKFYHNSKTKPCWSSYYKSKVGNSETSLHVGYRDIAGVSKTWRK
jgi:hypothetical protein